MDAEKATGAEGAAAERDPFEVLGVLPSAGAREIERAGQRLLAMIAAGVADDCSPEAEHAIRHALDELRNARQRLIHEMGAYALGPETLGERAIEDALQQLRRALPGRDVRSHAFAETLLWHRCDAQRDRDARETATLPADHAERRARAFAKPTVVTSVPDADWAETVLPPLPVKARKGTRA